MVWREPINHFDDYYSCLNNMEGFNKNKKKTWKYPKPGICCKTCGALWGTTCASFHNLVWYWGIISLARSHCNVHWWQLQRQWITLFQSIWAQWLNLRPFLVKRPLWNSCFKPTRKSSWILVLRLHFTGQGNLDCFIYFPKKVILFSATILLKFLVLWVVNILF